MLFGGGCARRPVLRGDAIRSEGSGEPGERSLRVVEGPRRPDSVLVLGRGGRVRPRRAAEAAADRLRPRRPSDTTAAVRGRCHRLARPGRLRGDRQRAQRAPYPIRLPHVRAPRRRRVGRRLRLGGGRRGGDRRPRHAVRHHRRQRARAEPADDVAARHGGAGAPVARLRLAHDRDRRPRLRRHPRRARRSPANQGAADDDPGADDQGQGCFVCRRQGGLARPGIQEGRRARQRAERARDASSCRRRSA